MEEWRDVVGYEGLYEISNFGRVKSLNYRKTGEEGLLSPQPTSRDYLQVGLSKNGKRKIYSIHRLVAIAFIPNPNDYPEVNHKDEDKSNNCVDNLEWCTSKYNANYGTRSKRQSENHADFSGDKHPRATKIKCVTTGEVFTTIKEASEKYNISNRNICSCCRGKLKSAGKHPVTGEKLVWEYEKG